MRKKHYRAVFYLILLIGVAGGVRLIYGEILSRRPIPPEEKITTATTYTLCGHEVRTALNLSREGELTLRDLRSLYTAREGWDVVYTEDGVEIERNKDDLCSSCRKKTHLGRKGDFVAVIRGPAGIDGGILRVTTIRLSDLPSTVRTQVEKGKLDLPDEKALLQILDSLEENTE